MADNIVDISILGPLQFTKEGFANPLPYNTRYRDQWQYPDTFSSLFTIPDYFQPWQLNDILEFQILSNYAPHQIELYDCMDNQVPGGVFSFTYIATSIEATGGKCYQASIAMNVFAEGIYRFKIKSGNPVLETYVSNYFDLRALHENTVLIEATHNENDFDVVFETGIVLRLRVHGAIMFFQPGMDRVVYIDQRRNATQLSGNPFNGYTFIIGDEAGVPDYLIEKINDLNGCSKVLYDGKQFTAANEGTRFEAKREDLYALTGWAFELRESEAKTKTRFIASGNQGTPSSVLYNIEQKGFGPASSQASTNIIQIQELN
jgi:hypothetical protein